MTSTQKALLTSLVFILGCNVVTVYEVVAKGNVTLYAEGQFIEKTSSFCFLTGAIMLFWGAFHRSAIERFIACFLACLNLVLFLREEDVEDFNIPFPIKELSYGTGRDVVFSLIFISLITWYLWKFRRETRSLISAFRSLFAKLLFLAAAFFLTGSLFENFENQFFEELLEVNGAFSCFLASAVFAFSPQPLQTAKSQSPPF